MANFDSAIGYVLGNEGGYVNDPDDPGGETKYGICKRDHPSVDIKNLTVAQADDIYRQQYWLYDGIQSQQVATKLFDMAVNMEGTGKAGIAIRITQQAALAQFPLAVDGIYGPGTEYAINQCNPTNLLGAMVDGSVEHYKTLVARNSRLAKFLDGWLVRARKLPMGYA